MRKRALALVVVLLSAAACKSSSPTAALQPKECPDPCCGGHPSIDCAENPNVSCTEDAEPCTAHAYGCLNGSFYLRPAATLPPGCFDDEAGADADLLVLGDGNVFGSGDAPNDAGGADAASDAPADTATEETGGD
jgi:hypothetical protein